MGFHNRHISTENIISVYTNSGAKSVFELYTKGVDSISLNGNLAFKLNNVINNDRLSREESILEISKLIELSEDFKKI